MLQIHGVSKRFPGVIALDSVDISLASGEVVALLGENGAGKSTLMTIIGGVYQADAGSLIVNDVPCIFRSPAEALDKGIRVVFQELSVLENLDISENIFLGRELRKAGLVDRKKMRELTVGYLEKVGLKRPPSTPVAAPVPVVFPVAVLLGEQLFLDQRDHFAVAVLLCVLLRVVLCVDDGPVIAR